MADPIDDYFSRFPGFQQDSQEALLIEFNRLAHDQGWGKRKCAEERKRCLLAQLEFHVGDDSAGQHDQLARLQELCRELRVSPVPTTVTQCKKVRSDIVEARERSLSVLILYFERAGLEKRSRQPH